MRAALVRRVRRLERAQEWRAEPEKADVRSMARRIVHILNRAADGDRELVPVAKQILKILKVQET